MQKTSLNTPIVAADPKIPFQSYPNPKIPSLSFPIIPSMAYSFLKRRLKKKHLLKIPACILLNLLSEGKRRIRRLKNYVFMAKN